MDQWELIIIFCSAFIVLGLLLTGKRKLLFWFCILSMIIGSRRLYFSLGNLDFEFIPFTLLLLLTYLVTIKIRIKTLTTLERYALVAVLISIFIASFSGVTLDRALLWCVPIISFFITKRLIIIFVREERDFKLATNLFIFIAILISFLALITTFGFQWGRFLLSPAEYTDLTSSNVAYSYLGYWDSNTIFGIIPIALIFVPRLRISPILRFIIACTIVVPVIISMKRISYISLLLAVIFLIMDRQYFTKKNNIIMALLIIILSFFYIPNEVTDRFQLVVSAYSGERIDKRLSRINYAYDEFKESPVIGQGAGKNIFIHNGFLEILANMGLLLSLPLFIIFINSSFQIFKRNIVTNRWTYAFIIFLLSPFMFEAVLNRPEHFAFFGFFYGMMSAENIYSERKRLTANQGNSNHATKRNFNYYHSHV